ncbi:hypothetical protein GA0070622_6439 [Micromonospora sediminicola]|uniref:Uncharacterized protein n=1 Tax=Micromonospora sediminicola TaxID=946078 RepID=A0A1A9BK33_9ACTN|nr:hypothetical protein GA0070622_6439 [Micromonospora sediminicola]
MPAPAHPPRPPHLDLPLRRRHPPPTAARHGEHPTHPGITDLTTATVAEAFHGITDTAPRPRCPLTRDTPPCILGPRATSVTPPSPAAGPRSRHPPAAGRAGRTRCAEASHRRQGGTPVTGNRPGPTPRSLDRQRAAAATGGSALNVSTRHQPRCHPGRPAPTRPPPATSFGMTCGTFRGTTCGTTSGSSRRDRCPSRPGRPPWPPGQLSRGSELCRQGRLPACQPPRPPPLSRPLAALAAAEQPGPVPLRAVPANPRCGSAAANARRAPFAGTA